MSGKTSARGSVSSLVRILGALVVLAALGLLALQQANFLVGRAMLIAFGDTESTYKAAFFRWDGDVSAKEVVLYPYGPDEASAIRFEKVHVETPGWFWVLRAAFDRKLRVARLERLHVTLTGLQSEAGLDPTLGDLGPIGAVSASPFEAEGCAADSMWLRGELGDMGLLAEPTVLDFDYRVQGSELLTKIALTTPGVSRVQFERRERLPRPVTALALDQVQTATTYERWEISDQGFVKARNAYCAKKDGIDQATFVARHVASVQRLLETRGLVPDAASLAAYQDFAANGGQLAFGGEYTRPLHSTELYDVRDDGSAWSRMHGVLEHGSQRMTVQWARVPARPLRALEEGQPIWPALQAERAVAPAVASPATAVAAGAANAMASTQASASSATPASSAPAQLVAPGGKLEWDELPQYQGRVVKVWTLHNEPRTAMLLSANAREAHVRARMGGGHADYRIGREAFVRALLVQ